MAIQAIGAALAAGSLLHSILQKRQRLNVPDVSAEIARIRAQYEQARQQAIGDINYQAGQERRGIASNLAARGVYRSPVSENVFGLQREQTGRNIARASANIGAQEAGAVSNVLNSLLGANLGAQRYNQQLEAARQAELYGGLGALGTSLLRAGISSRPGSAVPPGGAPIGAPNIPVTQSGFSFRDPGMMRFAGQVQRPGFLSSLQRMR